MPFNPINFAQLSPQRSAMADLFGNILKGYEMGNRPAQMEREREQQELANAFLRMRNEQQPQLFASQMAGNDLAQQQARMNLEQNPQRFASDMQTAELMRQLQQQKINDLQKNGQLPFGGQMAPGDVGQDMWVDAIERQFGKDSDLAHRARENRDIAVNASKARQETNHTYANSLAFRNLPSEEKNRIIATAVGMGFDPMEASQRLSGGSTLEDLAQGKRINLSDVSPVYPLSGETRKQLANRQAFNAEIKNLEKLTSEPLEKTGRRFLGYSPEQVWGAIKNDNPSEQGKILASLAIQPELAALRLRAMNSQVGIEALREMQEKSRANMNVFESTISPEARKYMNQYLTDWISQSSNIFDDTIRESARLGNRNQTKSSVNDPLGLR